MSSHAAVALASTLHDPQAADLPNLLAALPDLAKRYAGMVIFATEETPAAAFAPLVAAGAQVTQHPTDYQQIGGRRLGAVRAAAELAPTVHLCDFDRLLHWWHHWPTELDQVLATLPNYDLVLLGRTARAWATHPANQLETEGLVNRLVAHLYGELVDVCSGSRGLSRAAVQYLVEQSREQSVGTDAEWPLLLQLSGQYHCTEVLTEGLEFETGDRFPAAVSAAGGLVAWNAANDTDPARWIFRTRLAADIVAAALRTVARIPR